MLNNSAVILQNLVRNLLEIDAIINGRIFDTRYHKLPTLSPKTET